jgi:peptidoglycan-associated lipoprotein
MRRCGSLPFLRLRGLYGCAVLFVGLLLTGCPPKYPKCDSDKDCKAKEYCVNGTCQQCRGDGDCGGGRCNQGRCEQPSGCSDDAPCPADQSCIDGKCRPCASDDQCGAGGKCNHGRCQRAAAEGPTKLPEGPGECRLEPVYFDFNESVLSTEATAAIDRNAECMKKGKGRPVTLTGHSDPRGTEEYNLALSDRRAQSVRDRLSRMGASGAMKIVAKGELEATGTDESGWAKDRRVDVQW